MTGADRLAHLERRLELLTALLDLDLDSVAHDLDRMADNFGPDYATLERLAEVRRVHPADLADCYRRRWPAWLQRAS